MAPQPFLFGKIPAHGDFIARGLSEATTRAWDGWSSAELSTAQAALGDRFEAAHDAVPPWGFATSEDAGWRAGAIAASIDSAGRRFLVAAGYGGLTGEEACLLATAIVARCESAIRRILSGPLAADAAVDLLCDWAPDESQTALAAAFGAAPQAVGVWWSMAGLTTPSLGAEPPAGLVSEALARTAADIEEAA